MGPTVEYHTTDESEFNCSVIQGCTSAEQIGYMFFYTPICITGIVCNIINVVVLTGTKFTLNGSTFTYLTAMAVADLTTLSLASPIGFIRCFPPSHTWQHYFGQIYEIYIYVPFVNTFATASVWMTVAVSVERYFFVTKSRGLCSRLHTKWVILFIGIASFLFHIPYFFTRRVSDSGHKEYTDWAKSFGYNVYSWIRLFFVKLLPLFLAAVFNCLLIKIVWNANQKRKSLVYPTTVQIRRQRMQVRTTGMLITVSLVFLLCNIMEPFIHSGVYTSLFGRCSIYTETYALLRTVSNTLEMLSFATNFIVYCLFMKQFVVALSAKCICVKDKPETTVQTINY